jgi:hypothetical protein
MAEGPAKAAGQDGALNLNSKSGNYRVPPQSPRTARRTKRATTAAATKPASARTATEGDMIKLLAPPRVGVERSDYSTPYYAEGRAGFEEFARIRRDFNGRGNPTLEPSRMCVARVPFTS